MEYRANSLRNKNEKEKDRSWQITYLDEKIFVFSKVIMALIKVEHTFQHLRLTASICMVSGAKTRLLRTGSGVFTEGKKTL